MRTVIPTQSFQTLICRLFRDRFQFCSGLVDLVVGVRLGALMSASSLSGLTRGNLQELSPLQR